jgi:hypothetical protein
MYCHLLVNVSTITVVRLGTGPWVLRSTEHYKRHVLPRTIEHYNVMFLHIILSRNSPPGMISNEKYVSLFCMARVGNMIRTTLVYENKMRTLRNTQRIHIALDQFASISLMEFTRLSNAVDGYLIRWTKSAVKMEKVGV